VKTNSVVQWGCWYTSFFKWKWIDESAIMMVGCVSAVDSREILLPIMENVFLEDL
jgi:hypothetical protein